MLVPLLYAGAQRLTREELTADDPRPVARKAARGLAKKYRWTALDLDLALAAIDRADPAGLDAWASGPEWWEAIEEELRKGYRPSWRPLVELAAAGAEGWRDEDTAGQVKETVQGMKDTADELASAASVVADVPNKLAGGIVKAGPRAVGALLGLGGLLLLGWTLSRKRDRELRR